MRRHRRIAVASVTAALCALFASAATADEGTPLGHAGRWITDPQGRVVVVHGFNVVAKTPPYSAAAVGVGADDAAFLAENGFTAIRLGVMWKAVEPSPGNYDERYLDQIEAVVNAMGAAGVRTLLDFHQDSFNERFGGQGFPDWAVHDDGVPTTGAPIVDPAQLRAWDNFYADAGGVQTRYREFWGHVAKRFATNPAVLGYDLVNEPSPGSALAGCVNPVSCPFDAQLGAFYRRTIAAVHSVDTRHLVFYEPNIVAGTGGGSQIPDTGDPLAGESFHAYCTLSILGPSAPTGARDSACPPIEEQVLAQADQQSEATGDALLLTEFGSTPHLPEVTRVAAGADAHRVGWMHWTYVRTGVTDFAGTPSLVHDPRRAPAGDNVDGALLKTLARPHPLTVSGTPQAWSFDPATRTFTMQWTPQRADGNGRFAGRAATVIATPPVQYPDGYRVEVEGARVVSAKRSTRLILRALSGASAIRVTVTPGAGVFPRVRPGLRARSFARGRSVTTLGTLRLPLGVRRSDGCSGYVSVRLALGRRTVARRRAKLSPNCTFRVAVRGLLGRKYTPLLRVTERFGGNAVLLPVGTRRHRVHRVG